MIIKNSLFKIINKVNVYINLNATFLKKVEASFLKIQFFLKITKITPIKIYLIRNLEKFKTNNIIGNYYKKKILLYCPIIIKQQELLEILLHEYVHYIHSHFKSWKKTPLWIAEGLARTLANQKIEIQPGLLTKDSYVSISQLEYCDTRELFIDLNGFTFSQIYVSYLIQISKNTFLTILGNPNILPKYISSDFEPMAINYFLHNC